jgi:parallel beta-helix repeat protein
VANSIAATLVSGSSQTVSFSASGLPSGSTGSFSSTSCTPACSTVFSISTTGSTPAGNFPITITSTGGGVTKTTAFTLSVTLALTVATPTITPNGGNFSDSVSVAMQTAIPGASIYYTTNGSTPTQSSSLYTGPMTLTSDTTINAKAFKSGSNPSAVAAASFKNSQIAKGATYWTSPTGTATSCVNSATDPGPSGYHELYFAVETCARGGDTVILKPGVYDKHFYNSAIPAGTPSQYTTIRGELNDKTSTVLRPTYRYAVIYLGLASHRYIEFANMKLDASNLTGGPAVKISDESYSNSNPCGDCGPQYIRLRNMEIDGGCRSQVSLCTNFDTNAAKMNILAGFPGFEMLDVESHDGIYGLYWTGSGGAPALIERNWIHHNVGYGIHIYCNGCAFPVSNNIVRYNLFENNGTDPNFCANALIFASGSNNAAYNNIFNNNGTGSHITPGQPAKCGGSIQLSNGGNNSMIYNNTVYNSAGGIYTANTSGHIIRNNILWNNVYQGQGRDFFNDGGSASFMQSNNLCATGNVACAVTINPLFASAEGR